MRDLVVREALVEMARDAAKCLHGLISEGEELPYEVREPGDGSPLARYEPLTELFVRDHAGDLRSLDSFGTACAALESVALSGPYLERMGIGVPADERRRGELAGLAFLCRLWMGTTDFTLDDERLEVAIAELDAVGEASVGQIDVIVPLRGLTMPVSRLDLAPASIVRSDTVEVPADARSSEGLGVAPWEPAFLAFVRVDIADYEGGEAEAGLAAVDAFRRLITTLRLFKSGGVGLGPHAWTRAGGDRWRRIATGSGRQRPGGYRLSDAELGELAAFSRALSSAGTPFSRQVSERPGFPAALRRSINRFEAGLERNVVVEALNDHLLALRFLLEGGGPADLGLSMRVAALCAEPEERPDVKAVIDRAIGLERELWSGEPAAGGSSVTPAETAAELEELARMILKDAAAGHLGSDLRTAADEILLADGLAVGDGAGEQRGGTSEWDVDSEDAIEPEIEDEIVWEEDGDEVAELEESVTPFLGGDLVEDRGMAVEVSELDARISPEAPAEPDEQLMTARAREIFSDHLEPEAQQPEPASPVLRLIEQTRAERRARQDRVSDLFPAPETTEWNVREIGYDRSRRARVESS
jgi:hypothetical protein